MGKEERLYRHSEISEKALEKRLVDKAREFGFMVLKNQDPMMSGMPDRLIVMPDGKTTWVEFKSKGKKPTALQESRIRRLREMGHLVFVVDNRVDLSMVEGYIKYFRP